MYVHHKKTTKLLQWSHYTAFGNNSMDSDIAPIGNNSCYNNINHFFYNKIEKLMNNDINIITGVHCTSVNWK